jgi:hypothetical protein
MAAAGAVDVLLEMTEPLENYKAGVKHVVGATSATMSWPDWEYPTRDLDAERVYDYDPFNNVETWWIKSTFTVIEHDGTAVTTTTYSQQAPLTKDFRMEDIKYRRIGLSGAHQTSFSYDAYEKVVCYAARMGSRAWGRPVMVRTQGNEFVAVFRTDIKYETPTIPYQDDHYAFIGPSSLGPLGSMVQWKPHWDEGTNVQIYQVSAVTML